MYESFFNLAGKPFQLNPDPDFFFGSRGHKRAMAYLEYGLHQAEGFIVITGEVGAGKTTLVRNLLRRLPVQTIVPVQIVSTQLDADDTLRIVAGSFGIRDTTLPKAELLLRLEQHLLEMHRDGKRALLVIDEAQNLTARAVEELRMLSNFQVDTRSLLQSFLVGQPEFREMMQRPEMRQLKQRIIASYHLGPMDRAETQQYVEHRLRHVGWKDDPHFEPAAFDRIFDFTAGTPRRINTLCDRLMLGAYLAERHVVAATDVDEATREIADEIGESPQQRDRRTQGMPDSPHSARGHGAHGGLRSGLGGLQGQASLAHELDALMQRGGDGLDASDALDRIVQLEERIASLEASNAMTQDVVRKALRLIRAQVGPAAVPAPQAAALDQPVPPLRAVPPAGHDA